MKERGSAVGSEGEEALFRRFGDCVVSNGTGSIPSSSASVTSYIKLRYYKI